MRSLLHFAARVTISGWMVWALALLSIPLFALSQQSQFSFDRDGNLQTRSSLIASGPSIIAQPQPQIVPPGSVASFFVVAADTTGLTYQWQFNTTNINGATNDALLLTNISALNEGLYSVVLSNSVSNITSASAALYIDSDGDGLPDSWEMTYFGNLAQNATGDFDGDGNSNLTEFLDGTNPTNSASVQYRLTVLVDGGQVSYTPNKSTYTNGESVTLSATANPGEIFHGWTGDVISRSNIVNVVMNTNKTVYANFQPRSITWISAVSGSWHNPSNWSPNLVPTMVDDVTINTGVTLSIDEPADCKDYGFNGSGIVTGSDVFTIHGNAFWTNGSMYGTGRTVIASNAVLNVGNFGVTMNTRTLDNAGTVVVSGGGAVGLFGSVFTNRPGALYNIQNALTAASAGARFDNAGTFRKSVSSGQASLGNGALFNNYNAVEILTGTLDIQDGGTNSGTMSVAAGATLSLSTGGTFSSGPSGDIEGAGQLLVNGAVANLAGVVNFSGTNIFNGGTANLTGNYICTNNTLVISGGVANFNGTGTVNPNLVTMTSGLLGGIQTVTVGSVMNWNGGVMVGGGRLVIPATASLNITNAGATMNPHVLDNSGTVLVTGGGSLSHFGGSVTTNRAGALFQIQNAVSGGSDSGRFDNAGTFRKSVSTGTTGFGNGILFNNYNAVELQAGTLVINGGGANSGAITLSSNTTLSFTDHTFSSGPTGDIEGPGQLFVDSPAQVNLAGLVNLTGTNTFNGGTANLTGNYISSNNTIVISGGTANFNGTGTVNPGLLTMTSGLLGGSQTVTVGSNMNWNGGIMVGGGRLVISSNATLSITNAGVTMNPHNLDNSGTVLVSGGGSLNLFGGSIFTNHPGALLQLQNANGMSSDFSRLDNAGTVRKSVSTGSIAIGNGVTFNNYGTVDIRSGILVVNGFYLSAGGALLNCALGGATPGTGYGQLQAANAVTLVGNLSVDLLPGYNPATNDSFTVLTTSSRSGTFANFSFPPNRVAMVLSNTATAVILTVTNVFPIPQPVLQPPVLAGSNVSLTWTATSNVYYRLEQKADLALTNWTAVPGDVTTTSNLAGKLDALTASNRFYRVHILP